MSAMTPRRVAKILIVIRHGCPGCGMNVAFSSADENYNPSQFVSGGWYNSELMNYPGYGQSNLNTAGEYVEAPILRDRPRCVER